MLKLNLTQSSLAGAGTELGKKILVNILLKFYSCVFHNVAIAFLLRLIKMPEQISNIFESFTCDMRKLNLYMLSRNRILRNAKNQIKLKEFLQ